MDDGAHGGDAERLHDRPDAYLAGDRRRAVAAGVELPTRVSGAALMADVSGFTRLAEVLAGEVGRRRGAEELTDRIDHVFHGMIDVIHRRGGEVIYFSGDAVTCWFDQDDGSGATAAAAEIQAAMPDLGRMTGVGGTDVQLSAKLAVATGPAHRFVVGDPAIQLIDVLAGAVVHELAAAEGVTSPGEVVLAPSAVASLGDRVALGERRDGAAVLHALIDPTAAGPGRDDPELDPERSRPWLLPDVFERLVTGRGEFLAELRSAYPMFVRFDGFDVDRDPEAPRALDRFVRLTQTALSRYGGNVLQLTLGDKGAYLYGLFGSPRAHEDDAVRACAAAMELLADAGDVGLQIGIAHGPLFSGTYGHPRRRTFTGLGDAVNLAARLMMAAPAATVFVSEEVRDATGDAFDWEAIGALSVKGRVASTEVSALRGRATSRPRQLRYPLPMLGRDVELRTMLDAFANVVAGTSQCLCISGAAGTGKSRLVAEAVRRFRELGAQVAYGEAASIASGTSYAAWREIVRRVLDVDDLATPTETLRTVTAALARLGPTHAERAPLLAPILGIDLPDTELTRSFDAKLRKASLEALVTDAVIDRARRDPTVIVIDDGHVMDELSGDLLHAVVRGTVAAPVLVLIAARDDGDRAPSLPTGVRTVEIQLEELDEPTARSVVANTAARLFGPDVTVAESLVELVLGRARGNPLYLEELLDYVRGHGLDPADPRAVTGLELPDSLHRLVLSRIDTIAESPRRTIKVASAVGHTFGLDVVDGALGGLGADAHASSDIEVAAGVHLVTPSFGNELEWQFRNAVVAEVAYESLPFARRNEIHRAVARWYEAQGAATVERHLDAVTHHWSRTSDAETAAKYLERAGEAAQRRYANAAAAAYYGQLAPMLEGTRRAEILLRLAKVLEHTGDWARAGATAAAAREVALGTAVPRDDAALTTVAWADVALAEIARKQGRYDDAASALELAEAGFASVGLASGRAQVLHLRGTLAAQQGRHDEARLAYRDSLALREELGDPAGMASLWSNLGVIEEYDGEYDLADSYHRRALALRTDLGDRWAIAVSHTNLGMIAVRRGQFELALAEFEEAMRLNLEVGDPWMVAISHNNLGNAHRGRGAAGRAHGHYVEAARTYIEYDDLWAMAFLLEDMALLARHEGADAAAWRLLGGADACRAASGSPRSAAQEAELLAQLRPSDPLKESELATLRESVSAQGVEVARTVLTHDIFDRLSPGSEP